MICPDIDKKDQLVQRVQRTDFDVKKA